MTALVKQQLVDAIRMLERAGIIDHNGHCSARRDAGTFYINSGASVRGALTVEDIVTVDMDGHLVEGSARPPSSSTSIPRCIAPGPTSTR